MAKEPFNFNKKSATEGDFREPRLPALPSQGGTTFAGEQQRNRDILERTGRFPPAAFGEPTPTATPSMPRDVGPQGLPSRGPTDRRPVADGPTAPAVSEEQAQPTPFQTSTSPEGPKGAGRTPFFDVYTDKVAARVVQEDLAELGYTSANGRPLEIDGEFGMRSGQALMKFQRASGLPEEDVTGEWNRNTSILLETALEAKAIDQTMDRHLEANEATEVSKLDDKGRPISSPRPPKRDTSTLGAEHFRETQDPRGEFNEYTKGYQGGEGGSNALGMLVEKVWPILESKVTEPHIGSGEGFITLGLGIVPTSGLEYNGVSLPQAGASVATLKRLGVYGNSSLDESLLDYRKVKKGEVAYADYMEEGETDFFKKATYEKFAAAVVDAEFRPNASDQIEARGGSFSSLDTTTQSALVDLAWNAGAGAMAWDSTGRIFDVLVDEPSDRNARDHTKLLPLLNIAPTQGGKLHYGVLKRRAIQYNLLAPEDKQATKVSVNKSGSGVVTLQDGTTYSVSRSKGTASSGTIGVPAFDEKDIKPYLGGPSGPRFIAGSDQRPTEAGEGEGGGGGGLPEVKADQLGMIGGVRDDSRVWQSFNASGMAHSTDYKDYSQLFREYTTTKKNGYVEVGKTKDGKPVYAAPDNYKDKDGNYVMVSKDDAIRMAKEMGSIMPQREWVKNMYGQATRVRMATQPIYKTGGSGDSLEYTTKINAALKKKGYKQGLVVHGKEFFVSK